MRRATSARSSLRSTRSGMTSGHAKPASRTPAAATTSACANGSPLRAAMKRARWSARTSSMEGVLVILCASVHVADDGFAELRALEEGGALHHAMEVVGHGL